MGEEYAGLVGYFNKSQKKSPNKTKKKETKTGNTSQPNGGFLSYSYVPKTDGDDEKNETPKQEQTSPNKKKAKKQKNKSMKKGFLSGSGKSGLYSDKPKLDSELTVDELNAKNRKQIEEMGFADAVDNPLYTWERPKEDDKK